MILLSFIVPVYNVERHLSRCLDSLLKQNIPHSNYEIITVNDGSTDDSLNILNEYTSKHENIKTYTKANGGLSSSRNYGLSKCRGKYIWMVDSDDSIKENCLNELLDFTTKQDIDFLSIPMNEIIDNKIILGNNKKKPIDVIINQYEYLEDFMIEHSACCFIVKRDIIIENNIFFIEKIIHEDYDFVIRLLEKCNRITSYQKLGGIYNYYIGRTGSITTEMSKDGYIKTLDSFYISIKLLLEKYRDKTNRYTYCVSPYIDNMKCYALSYLLKSTITYNDKKRYYEKYKAANFFKIDKTRLTSTKVYIASYIYRCPFLYKTLMLLVFSKFNKKSYTL
ncbi:glycosyltransferase family 2 protein [Capnocytophaga cynodegmi]|uniref:glycosyltransferase family 2 protein n=1 Tax=Capnocytophaga cynodegmi TaxID=28189 RepID=UPI00385948D1